MWDMVKVNLLKAKVCNCMFLYIVTMTTVPIQAMRLFPHYYRKLTRLLIPYDVVIKRKMQDCYIYS